MEDWRRGGGAGVAGTGASWICLWGSLTPPPRLRPPALAQECMVACQEAEECESFVVNEVLAQCFLKTQQCPEYNFW